MIGITLCPTTWITWFLFQTMHFRVALLIKYRGRLLVLHRDEEKSRGPFVGDGLGVDDLHGREDGEVGHEGEDVEGGREGDSDRDGERQVPAGVLDLLGDKVEVVPAVVGPQPGEECQGDGAGGDRVAHRARDGIEPLGEESSSGREEDSDSDIASIHSLVYQQHLPMAKLKSPPQRIAPRGTCK